MASPEAIASRLRSLEDALDAGTEAIDAAVRELERLGIEASKAEVKAERHFAEVYLSAGGPEYYRKQVATLEAAEDRHAARIAKHLVTTQNEALWSLREKQKAVYAKIDVARTLAANTRAELEIDKVNWRP